MKLHLIQDGGPFADKVLVNRFPFVIGRHMACDHQLYHPMVSRRHCRLDRQGDRLIICDLASSNGTFVNGHPIRHSAPLRDGDLVSVACLSYRVSMTDSSVTEN